MFGCLQRAHRCGCLALSSTRKRICKGYRENGQERDWELIGLGLGEGLGSGVNGAGIKVGMGQKTRLKSSSEKNKTSLKWEKAPTGSRVVKEWVLLLLLKVRHCPPGSLCPLSGLFQLQVLVV